MKNNKLFISLISGILMLGTLCSCVKTPKGDVLLSGKAGDNIKWTFTSDNTLIFTGTGEMKEYYTGTSYVRDEYIIPWYSINILVEKVIIEEGITSICNFAFLDFKNLKTVDIAKSVTKIGGCAFQQTGLESLDFLNGLNIDISDYMFKNCHWLTEVMIPDGVESIGYNAFLRLGSEYFVGGDTIEYVHIPSSVKNISSTAFSDNPDIAFYIDLSKAPSGWESGWNNKSSNIYWLGEWEYVDGVPTPINN